MSRWYKTDLNVTAGICLLLPPFSLAHVVPFISCHVLSTCPALLSSSVLPWSLSYPCSPFSHLLSFTACRTDWDPSLMLALCFALLSRSCTFQQLSFLRCSFSRKARDSLPTFRQFFSSAFSLTHVSLASMKVPPDSLRWVTVTGKDLKGPLKLWTALSKMQITWKVWTASRWRRSSCSSHSNLVQFDSFCMWHYLYICRLIGF